MMTPKRPVLNMHNG